MNGCVGVTEREEEKEMEKEEGGKLELALIVAPFLGDISPSF